MWRGDSLEKILMLGKTEGKRRRGRQKMRWLDSITNSLDMNLSKLWKTVQDRKVWHAIVHGIPKSQRQLSDWTTATQTSVLLSTFWFIWVYPEVELLDCMEMPHLIFEEPPHCFPQQLYNIIFPSALNTTGSASTLVIPSKNLSKSPAYSWSCEMKNIVALGHWVLSYLITKQ